MSCTIMCRSSWVSYRGVLPSMILQQLPATRVTLLEVGDVIDFVFEDDPSVVGFSVFANLVPHERLLSIAYLALRSLAHAKIQDIHKTSVSLKSSTSIQYSHAPN